MILAGGEVKHISVMTWKIKDHLEVLFETAISFLKILGFKMKAENVVGFLDLIHKTSKSISHITMTVSESVSSV